MTNIGEKFGLVARGFKCLFACSDELTLSAFAFSVVSPVEIDVAVVELRSKDNGENPRIRESENPRIRESYSYSSDWVFPSLSVATAAFRSSWGAYSLSLSASSCWAVRLA